jgi:hypothetical protein
MQEIQQDLLSSIPVMFGLVKLNIFVKYVVSLSDSLIDCLGCYAIFLAAILLQIFLL